MDSSQTPWPPYKRNLLVQRGETGGHAVQMLFQHPDVFDFGQLLAHEIDLEEHMPLAFSRSKVVTVYLVFGVI